MMPDDVPVLALAPDATNLRPVYAISDAWVSAVPCVTGAHVVVAAAALGPEVETMTFPLPLPLPPLSPTANHLSPVNAIPVPSPEKHTELDSRTVRHVPAVPLISRE
jgi:hypothetical protein